jgi:hypothetical protein
MGEKRRRHPGFNLALTPRILMALGLGSVFVSFVVTHLAGAELTRRVEARETHRVREVARSLASRAAPLLEAKDDLRLAMMGGAAAQFGRYRVLLIDVEGEVRLDTGLAFGGKKMQLLTMEGSFHRRLDEEKSEFLTPALGLSGLVGEVRIRYPAQAAAGFSMSLFGGCLLACCSLLVVVGLLCHHWTSHIREAVTTAHSLAHGDLTAQCERKSSGVILELQDSLHDLGSVLGAGAQQVEQSFLELAFQSVEVLERRGKVGHGERTRTYAALLTRRLGLAQDECWDVETAANLHDLGEIYEPPRPDDDQGFDAAEVSRMRRTPSRGAEILEGIGNLRKVAEIVRHHREKFDGSGFPAGLQGERIALGARILGIADAYDQLTTVHRRHRKPLRWSDALDAIREDRGETFDPWLVDLFEEEIRRSPMPRGDSETVTISAGGAVPYKLTQVDPEEEEDPMEAATLYWTEEFDSELEVFGDDFVGGDNG